MRESFAEVFWLSLFAVEPPSPAVMKLIFSSSLFRFIERCARDTSPNDYGRPIATPSSGSGTDKCRRTKKSEESPSKSKSKRSLFTYLLRYIYSKSWRRCLDVETVLHIENIQYTR